MAERAHLFVDFDDTLSDYREHGRQYVANLGELLSLEFGETRDIWSAALQPAISQSLGRYAEKFGGRTISGFRFWEWSERERVVTEVFAAASVPLPLGRSPAELALVLQTEALIACNAALPGAGA